MKNGNQILLRDWIKEDLADYQFWNSGKKKWMDYNGPYYEKPTVAEIQTKTKELSEKIIAGNWETPRKNLVITSKKANKLIGSVSWYWQSKETNWMSIGIVLYDENYWGKGIGYEALSLWIDYLFEECAAIVRLDLRTWSGNDRVINLSKKLGFQEEARFRMARIVNGIYYDSIGMGLLRSEWESGAD